MKCCICTVKIDKYELMKINNKEIGICNDCWESIEETVKDNIDHAFSYD